MKRSRLFLALLLTVILICSAACSRNWDYTVIPIPVSDATEAPTEAPTVPPTQPQWQLGLSRASYVEAVQKLLEKGEEVEVIGRFAHYCIISAEPYDLLVDDNYVRLETEDAFVTYPAYARYNRPVYAAVYMKNEPAARLATNTALTVLEEGKDWVCVQWSDGQGYMKSADISKYRIKTGSSNSAPADGTDVNANDLSAIAQGIGVRKLGGYNPTEMYEESRKAVILADNVQACITVFAQGAEMKITAYDDEFCTVLLDSGLYAQVPRDLVMLEGDPEGTFFEGFAASGATVYTQYQCRSVYKTLKLNETVNVLYELPARSHADGTVYAVAIDGEVLYMLVSSVSKTKISTSSGAESSDVWTPPAL